MKDVSLGVTMKRCLFIDLHDTLFRYTVKSKANIYYADNRKGSEWN